MRIRAPWAPVDYPAGGGGRRGSAPTQAIQGQGAEGEQGQSRAGVGHARRDRVPGDLHVEGGRSAVILQGQGDDVVAGQGTGQSAAVFPSRGEAFRVVGSDEVAIEVELEPVVHPEVQEKGTGEGQLSFSGDGVGDEATSGHFLRS